MAKKDYYEVWDKGTKPEEIKQGYRDSRANIIQSQSGRQSIRERSNDHEAHDVLSDPKKRAVYDRWVSTQTTWRCGRVGAGPVRGTATGFDFAGLWGVQVSVGYSSEIFFRICLAGYYKGTRGPAATAKTWRGIERPMRSL